MDAIKKKRLAWYFKKNAVIITAILILLTLAFFLAMTSANVYIVAMEGMEARAAVVLNDTDTGELGYYFTENFLQNDSLLHSGKYRDYLIGRYTYALTPELPVCWPWQTGITIQASEWVGNVDGQLSQDRVTESDAKTRVPPAWDNGVYAISMVLQDGKWKIDSVQLRAVIKNPEPASAPTPPATPAPTGQG